MRLLLDSNILISALNYTLNAHTDRLLRGENTLHISVITWIEVMTGAKPAQEQSTRMFLDRFSRLEVTDAVAERAVVLRRTLHLKTPDAIIYATALETGRTLVTLNTRDFPAGTPSVLIPG